MKIILLVLAVCLGTSTLVKAQIPVPTPGGGGAPSGNAGGDLGGTYPNPTVVASHIASGGAAFTDKISAASSSSTSTTPTFLLTDNEPATSGITVSQILAPNMANNNDMYWLMGNQLSTSNSFFLIYHRGGAGSSNNRFSIQPYAVPIVFSVWASQHVTIGSSTTDSGYKLDVQGNSRAEQFVGGGNAPTIAAGTGAGTSPTIAVSGTSSAFTVNLTSGTTSAASAVIATVTFATAYVSAPHISCQAKNAATAAFLPNLFATTTTTTAVLNSGTTALTDTTAYSWDCLVIQ